MGIFSWVAAGTGVTLAVYILARVASHAYFKTRDEFNNRAKSGRNTGERNA